MAMKPFFKYLIRSSLVSLDGGGVLPFCKNPVDVFYSPRRQDCRITLEYLIHHQHHQVELTVRSPLSLSLSPCLSLSLSLSLLLSVPITYRSWQVLLTASSVRAKLMYVSYDHGLDRCTLSVYCLNLCYTEGFSRSFHVTSEWCCSE